MGSCAEDAEMSAAESDLLRGGYNPVRCLRRGAPADTAVRAVSWLARCGGLVVQSRGPYSLG